MGYQTAIKKIKGQIDSIQNESHIKSIKLRAQAMTQFTALMKTGKKALILKKMIEAVEASKDLTEVTGDECFSQWIRTDFSDLIDIDDEFQQELLTDFLDSNYCIRADFENDCLTYSIGPCVIINDDGDVLDQDSGKWIISNSDYYNSNLDDNGESLRNALIRAWMDKNGYFPSVISCDRHGNAFYVNIQNKRGSK